LSEEGVGVGRGATEEEEEEGEEGFGVVRAGAAEHAQATTSAPAAQRHRPVLRIGTAYPAMAGTSRGRVASNRETNPTKEPVMSIPRRIPVRLAVTVGAVVAVLTLGGFVAANAGSPSASDQPTTAPAWCCIDGTSHGVTVTGVGSVHGRGDDARDAAIARAVADATDQAKTAADAAGVTLGAVVDMQVSAPMYPFAVPEAASGSADSAVSSTTSVEPGAMCPMTTCGDGGSAPMPFVPSVSVTITWSIA
jgi:Protein of unknown function (DUF541)